MGIKFSALLLIRALWTCVLIAGVVLIIRFLVKRQKQKKQFQANVKKPALKWRIMLPLTVIVMVASWIFNMGWFRIILMWVPLPLVHTIVFWVLNRKLATFASTFKELEKYIVISCVTYLLPYLLFPDGGDVGEGYLFFGLIRNDIVFNIALYMTPIAFSASIAVLIWEYIELKKCRAR